MLLADPSFPFVRHASTRGARAKAAAILQRVALAGKAVREEFREAGAIDFYLAMPAVHRSAVARSRHQKSCTLWRGSYFLARPPGSLRFRKSTFIEHSAWKARGRFDFEPKQNARNFFKMDPSQNRIEFLSSEDRIVYRQWLRRTVVFYSSVVALLVFATVANQTFSTTSELAGEPMQTAAIATPK